MQQGGVQYVQWLRDNTLLLKGVSESTLAQAQRAMLSKEETHAGIVHEARRCYKAPLRIPRRAVEEHILYGVEEHTSIDVCEKRTRKRKMRALQTHCKYALMYK